MPLDRLFNWRCRLHEVLEHQTDHDYRINRDGRQTVSDVCWEIEQAFERGGGRTALLSGEAPE